MTPLEFINKLGEYTQSPNDIEIDAAMSWIQRHNLSDADLEILYYDVTDNLTWKNRFPGNNIFTKIWNDSSYKSADDNSDMSFLKKERDRWYIEYGVDVIIKFLKQISETGLRNVKSVALSFYAEFEQLLSEYYFMKEMKMSYGEIKENLVMIKGCLEGGEFFKSFAYSKNNIDLKDNKKMDEFKNTFKEENDNKRSADEQLRGLF